MSNTVIGRITEVKNISKLSDIIVSELPLEYNEVLKYVSITNPMNRIREITLDLSKEIETVRLENEIEDNLKVKLEEEQKEYIDTAVSMMEKAQKRFLEMREEPKYTAGIAKSVIWDIMSSDKNFMETTQRLFAKTIYHNT